MPRSFLILFAFALLNPAHAEDWPQFRGADASSTTERDDLPIAWSVETGENIAWAADLPGNGLSSPIIVDGRAIVTAASGADNDRLHVLAFDQATGEKQWQRQFWATGRTQCHHSSSIAAGTPASDGQRIFALYSSNDLVALDLDGNLLWMRSLTQEHPKLGNDIGMASSPIVVGDRVIVQCECQTAAFVAAFDAQTGADAWLVERPNAPNWSSPIAVHYSGAQPTQPGVLFQGPDGVTLVAASDGDTLWNQPGEAGTMSSPSASRPGMILSASNGLSAFTRTADGMQVAWQQSNVKVGSASPVVADGKVFTFTRGGILSAVNLADGERAMKKKRLGGTFWGTPLATPSRLYCPNQDGSVFVISTTDGEVLAENKMGADLYCSPATADGALFLRSNGKLWKIATLTQAKRPGAERR